MSPSRLFPLELLSASVILDALDEGVLLIDQGNRVAWINSPLARLLGIDRDAFCGSDADRFVRRHLAPRIADKGCREQIAASPSDQSDITALACTIRSSDGKERRVLLSSRVVQDEPFQGMRLIRLHADLLACEPHLEEERQRLMEQVEKHAEESATANEELKTANEELEVANEELYIQSEELRTIVENLSEGIWMVDENTRTTFVNDRMAEMLGYTVEEMLGKPLAAFLPDEDRGRLDEERERRRAGVQDQLEYTFVRKDGSPIVTILVTSSLFDRQGTFTGAIAGVMDITERKQAEEELRSSTETISAIFELSPIAIFLTRIADGKIAYCNQAFPDLLGYTSEEVAGVSTLELGIWGGPEDRQAYLEEIRNTGAVRNYEWRIRRRDGTRIDILLSSRFITVGGEQLMLTFGRDISERKQAEEALQESEEKYRRLFESMGEAFVLHEMVYDEEGRPVDYSVLEINPTYEKVTGFHRDQVIGRHITEIIPIVEPIWFERYDEVVRTGRSMRFEEYNVGLDRWYGIYAFPVHKENQFAVIFTDITERKHAEDALRESEEKLRTLFDSLPIGISVLDADRKIREANPALGNILDITQEDLLNAAYTHRRYLRSDGTEMPPEEFPSVRAFEEQKPVKNVEIGVVKEDGTTIWTSVSAIPLHVSDWSVVVATSDVTKQKRAEEALMRRTDDLVRLNREIEEARHEENLYLDIMTHDIRNANTVSGVYADLLVELLAGDQWLYARKLRDAVQRSTEILMNVDTIRKIKRESARLVPVNLDAVIREEIGNFPGAAISYDGRRVDVLADGLLPGVFTNLIGNAVKFGGLEVEITIRLEEQDGEVLVTVADTGPGVPDEVKEKLFTRFERGMAKGKGQGLGLFIVRTLVERYGGAVWIEDRVPGRPEEGTAFRFTLREAMSRPHRGHRH